LPALEIAGSGFILAPEETPDPAGQQALLALAKATALACQVPCCALVSETAHGTHAEAVSGQLPDDTRALLRDIPVLTQTNAMVESTDPNLFTRDQLIDSDPLRTTSFLVAHVLRTEQGSAVGVLALFGSEQNSDSQVLVDKLASMAQATQTVLRAEWYYDAYIHSPALLYSTNERGVIEEVSQLWLTHFGYKRDEVIGRSPLEFMTASARKDLEGFANHIHLTAGVKDFPSQFVTGGGRAVEVLMSIALERQANGAVDKASQRSKCLLVDITLQIQIQRALEARARLDEMTGIPNRAWIRERFQVEAARSARHKRPLTLVMFDADHFKRLNDEHGHAAGDHALVILANTARHQLRGADEVGRIGGEEFALVLPETGLAGAMHVAERLRQGVADLPLQEVGLPCQLTISLGVVEVSPGTSTDQAFARADAAMYEAKRTGRNRVVSWQPDLPSHPSAKPDPTPTTEDATMGPIV